HGRRVSSSSPGKAGVQSSQAKGSDQIAAQWPLRRLGPWLRSGTASSKILGRAPISALRLRPKEIAMRFVKAVWKLLVGIKDLLVLLFMLMFFGLLYAGLSARPAAINDGVLAMDLDGVLVEQASRPDPFAAIAGAGNVTHEFELRD